MIRELVDAPEDLVMMELRRSDIQYLLDTPRPFYRNGDETTQILDEIRRALANGRAEGRH